MYSCTDLACPRYPGSLSRCEPVVPNTNGGPTCPFAPGIPGMMWHTGQPDRVKMSMRGSSPVTSGIVSRFSAAPTDGSSFGREAGRSRTAQTTDNSTRAIAVRTTSRSGDRGVVILIGDEDFVRFG